MRESHNNHHYHHCLHLSVHLLLKFGEDVGDGMQSNRRQVRGRLIKVYVPGRKFWGPQ